jgi:hypothetical protein
MPHLLLAVTAHGYGHLAQCAPVVEALLRRIPGISVTLQGDIDPAFARRRLPAGFTQIRKAADVGLLMDGPLATRWAESLEAYGAFEAEYERRLERQMGLLRDLAPDLVLADVPWLPLDAARRLGIPAVGLCSLTWYDILQESPLRAQVPAGLLERMASVYGAADLFIRPAPAMPMGWLPNGVDVGPIASQRPDRGAEIRARLGLPPDRPLALLQFGGFEGFDPLLDWPEQGQVHWLVQDLVGGRRGDASAFVDVRCTLLDLLGSFDLMLIKPGYGSIAEAACNGVPVLYVSRGDWPEEPILTEWIRQQVPALEIPLPDLVDGRLAGPIAELLAGGRARPVEPTGTEAAADLLEPFLRGSRRG